MPTLFVIRGADQGSRFELTEPTTRFGREGSNTLQIHDTEVSRHHAEIRSDPSGCTISDLGSSNGTFINGQRVRQHKLQSGDQIQMAMGLPAAMGLVLQGALLFPMLGGSLFAEYRLRIIGATPQETGLPPEPLAKEAES